MDLFTAAIVLFFLLCLISLFSLPVGVGGKARPTELRQVGAMTGVTRAGTIGRAVMGLAAAMGAAAAATAAGQRLTTWCAIGSGAR
jgi:hypothetical protein